MALKQIFGTGGIAPERLSSAIKWAGEAGYSIIDTAWLYENESAVGKAVAEYNEQHETKLEIQTKIDPRFNEAVKEIFAIQLKDLGVKKVHTLLLHRPHRNFDLSVKAWKSLIELQKENLVKRIGVSNFDKDMLEILFYETGVWPAINQIELSVVNFRADRVEYCQKMGIEVQAWRPNGVDSMATKDEVVVAMAADKKITTAQLALAFLLSQNIVPVARSSSKEHIVENARADNVVITKEEIAKLLARNQFLSRSSATYDHPYSKMLYYDLQKKK